jgi:hypothetical protein
VAKAKRKLTYLPPNDPAAWAAGTPYELTAANYPRVKYAFVRSGLSGPLLSSKINGLTVRSNLTHPDGTSFDYTPDDTVANAFLADNGTTSQAADFPADIVAGTLPDVLATAMLVLTGQTPGPTGVNGSGQANGPLQFSLGESLTFNPELVIAAYSNTNQVTFTSLDDNSAQTNTSITDFNVDKDRTYTLIGIFQIGVGQSVAILDEYGATLREVTGALAGTDGVSLSSVTKFQLHGRIFGATFCVFSGALPGDWKDAARFFGEMHQKGVAAGYLPWKGVAA